MHGDCGLTVAYFPVKIAMTPLCHACIPFLTADKSRNVRNAQVQALMAFSEAE